MNIFCTFIILLSWNRKQRLIINKAWVLQIMSGEKKILSGIVKIITKLNK